MDIECLLAPYGTKNGKPNPPNPTQKRVLEWVDKVRAGKHEKSGIPTLLLMGGVGSGKSRGILAAVMELLIEIADLRVLWGRQDFKDIKMSIMDKFFEVMPQELIAAKSEQYHWYEIRQPGGTKSRIFFNGLKDLSGLGSQEFGVICVTEAHETTLNAYRTLKRRCRQENVPVMILMESEPSNEGHWMTQLTNKASDDYDPDIEVWNLSTYENWKNLPEAYKESLETMPEAWKKKYLQGQPGFIPDGKPFYSGFKYNWHVSNFEVINNREVIVGLDFGFHHPAAVFCQVDLNDRLLILKEYMPTDVTVPRFAEGVISIINNDFKNCPIRYFGDPASKQVNDKSEKTTWEILRDLNINVICSTSHYRTRKEIIEKKLSTLNSGKPQLMVDASCKTIIDGFLGGYHYPNMDKMNEFTDKYETPFRDGYYEHLMNAFEYIVVNMFKPIEKKQRPLKVLDKPIQNMGFGF